MNKLVKMNKIEMLIDSKNLQDMYAVIDDMIEWDLIDSYKQYVGDPRNMQLDMLRYGLLEYVEKKILADIVSKAKEV